VYLYKLAIAMNRAKRIEQTLSDVFRPVQLTVTDESHLHAGHVGSAPGGETHYRVEIVSEHFLKKSRLQRHRLVNEALDSELQSGLHALAIRASTPDENSA